MELEIRWTKRASNNFDRTVEYIENEWGERSIQKFIQKVNKFLVTLEKHPEIGKIEIEQKGIRAFVFPRQNTVFDVRAWNYEG